MRDTGIQELSGYTLLPTGSLITSKLKKYIESQPLLNIKSQFLWASSKKAQSGGTVLQWISRKGVQKYIFCYCPLRNTVYLKKIGTPKSSTERWATATDWYKLEQGVVYKKLKNLCSNLRSERRCEVLNRTGELLTSQGRPWRINLMLRIGQESKGGWLPQRTLSLQQQMMWSKK